MDGFWIDIFQRLAKDGIVSLVRAGTKRRHTEEPRPIDIAESRLRRLLTDYQITETQLPRIVPEDWKWTLGELPDAAAILKKLTGKRLEWFASLFGVRTDWLEGTFDETGHTPCEKVYDRIWLYKDIGRVQHHLERMKWSANWPQMTVFADDLFKDELTGSSQLAVVFTYTAPESDLIRIRRHIVCGDEWSWSYSPTRIQLKALARWFWMTYSQVVPLVPLKSELLKAVVHGEALVESHVPYNTTCYDMFELFGLSHSEASAAKDTEEFPAVESCFDRYFGTTLNR
ncbi:MAG: hypothetical protein JSS49_27545 [Planctomycetes bacterium]|nr:hypothetical protein [Planctomycetota bacterium]